MARRLATCLALALLLSSARAFAQNEAAEDKLGDAFAEFGLSHHDKAIKLLEAAESLTSDPELLAKIFRQRGIIEESRHKASLAVIAFLRALRFDPRIDVNKKNRASVLRLFECSRALNDRGIDEEVVRNKLAERIDKDPSSCPLEDKATPPLAGGPKPGPTAKTTAKPTAKASPVPTPVPSAAPPKAPVPTAPPAQAQAPEGGGVGWPVWAALGTGVAAAGAGTIFGLQTLSTARDGDPATDPHGPALVANVAFGVAAVAIGAGIALWLLGSD